jgi:phosphoribosyl-ATP pyrophosphohydrolase
MGKSAKTQPLKQAALTTKSLLGAQKVANAKPAKLKAAGLKATGEKAAKAMPAPPAPAVEVPIMPPLALGASAAVLDRLWAVVMSRRDADPAVSHSARLLSRGTAKIAQKFGEEAVECLIEAVGGDRAALVAESADVLYHLLVMWVNAGVRPEAVWAELQRREGISGIAEKASRVRKLPAQLGMQTTKIP